MVSLFLYFVTSSDSASLVIDCLTANGDPDPPYVQRVFWSLTEGAVAITLLYAGEDTGLKALRGFESGQRSVHSCALPDVYSSVGSTVRGA